MVKVSKFFRSARAFARELARGFSRSEIQSANSVAPRRPLIGLALGGGFARGLAHIGVLKVLEEERIPIDFVAGTSVGAVMGAAYCSGISVREMEEIAGLVRFRDFARWTISRLGLCTTERMAAFLEKVLKARTFEELKIPLAVTATDFITGEGKVWTSGPLIDPVRASCAYPGMFLPVRVDGHLYVDGLLAYAVPTLPLRSMGAEKVLAIYLSSPWSKLGDPRHIFEIISQCFSIAESKSCGSWKAAADLILTPNVRGFTYDDFQKAKRLVASGEQAAREMLPQIREWLAPSQPPTDVTLAELPPEMIATTLPESPPPVPKAA